MAFYFHEEPNQVVSIWQIITLQMTNLYDWKYSLIQTDDF